MKDKGYRDKKLEEKQRKGDTLRTLVYFSQIGITVSATLLTGVLIGKYLDQWLGSAPWFLLIFSLLGAGAAIKTLFGISSIK